MATNILVTQLTKVRVYWNNNLLNMNCILLFTLLVSYNQAHQGSYGKKTKGLEICVNGLGNRGWIDELRARFRGKLEVKMMVHVSGIQSTSSHFTVCSIQMRIIFAISRLLTAIINPSISEEISHLCSWTAHILINNFRKNTNIKRYC